MRTPTVEKKVSDPFFFLFWLFLSEILSRRCRLSRTTSNPAQKSGKFQAKIAFFLMRFSGKKIAGTILSRRSRLSRTSKAPYRLRRQRPINCDAGHDRQTKTFPVFAQLFFRTSSKKSVFCARHLVVTYTPKEAHSRIFVTGGSYFA